MGLMWLLLFFAVDYLILVGFARLTFCGSASVSEEARCNSNYDLLSLE